MVQHIYAHCPSYETKSFLVRLVQPGDAAGLLCCYADPEARRFFNSDNCDYGFAYDTLPEMQACIAQWLQEYQNHCFVRFAVVEKQLQTAIGTVEMFHKDDLDTKGQRYGILRIDLAAKWEKREQVSELLALANREFFSAFGVTHILTKAVLEAQERTAALRKNRFLPVKGKDILSYGDYWVSVQEGESYLEKTVVPAGG